MEIVERGLTAYGLKAVRDALNSARADVLIHKQELEDAEKRLEQMKIVDVCDHDFDEPGGLDLIRITCKKCGFSWYD